MMDKNKVCTVDDLFALFADVLSPADVLSAKLMGQISSAITKERLDLNLTQKEFASYIDATQSLVSRWERGDYNFSINKIAEIASKLYSFLRNLIICMQLLLNSWKNWRKCDDYFN